MKDKRLEQIYTIKELLRSRRNNPILTLELVKDLARRIVKIEKELGIYER